MVAASLPLYRPDRRLRLIAFVAVGLLLVLLLLASVVIVVLSTGGISAVEVHIVGPFRWGPPVEG